MNKLSDSTFKGVWRLELLRLRRTTHEASSQTVYHQGKKSLKLSVHDQDVTLLVFLMEMTNKAQ